MFNEVANAMTALSMAGGTVVVVWFAWHMIDKLVRKKKDGKNEESIQEKN